MNSLPPLADLRERLSYDPQTGKILWRKSWYRIKAGDEAGNISSSDGYRYIKFNQVAYSAHRLAYYLHHEVDPYPSEIDHKNRIRTDNSISNLRLADRVIQNENRGPHGHKPVRITYPDGRGSIVVNSLATAARVLNRPISTISRILNKPRNKQLHWGTGRSAQPSGITVAFCEQM